MERYGIDMALHSGGDLLVVRLFAVFHDVCRLTDSHDEAHGARGAELAAEMRGDYFELPDADFAKLVDACSRHTDGLISDDPTIGACWDADRLDLWRAGCTPHAVYMSTDHARALAHAGKVGPQYIPDVQSPNCRRNSCELP